MKKKHAYITDHALMRYMQRVHNVDVEAYREEMHSPELETAVKSGARRVQIDGFSFKCKEGKIVTTWNRNHDGRDGYGKALAKPRKRRLNDKRGGGGSHRSKKRDLKGMGRY